MTPSFTDRRVAWLLTHLLCIAGLVPALRSGAGDDESTFFQPPPPGPRITIDAMDAELQDVLKQFQRALDMPFVLDEGLHQRVSVHADNQDAGHVLMDLLRSLELAYDRPGGRVRRMSAFEKREAWLDSEHTRAEIDRRKLTIDAELSAAPAPSWAGKYEANTGFQSSRIWLAPTAGFLDWWPDDTGLAAVAWGTIQAESPTHLILHADMAQSRDGELPFRAVHIVPWGPELYALEEAALLPFINAVNRLLKNPI